MLELNLTLLVQIGNFFIAYFILRRYVFIPALRILDTIEKKQFKLQEEVQHEESAYREQIRMHLIQSKSMKSKLTALAPDIDDMNKVVCSIPEITAQQIQFEVSSEEIEKIKETIVKNVLR